jgi:hypothetical protein
MSMNYLSFKMKVGDREERNRRTLCAKDSFKEDGSEYWIGSRK